MLKFKRLDIKNFGPFRGEQTIEFPNQQGVTIVYGQNGRGKTTLLNAVRYVLYGYFITRGSKELEFQKVINTDALEIGEYEFSVTLVFIYGGNEYELSRVAKPKDSSKKPKIHNDYEQEFFLKRDGIIIPISDTERVLEQIMPEQVSRFFLFDGELLQEYEELVAKKSETGRKIKESIERILGLPLLTESRTIMQILKQQAQTQQAKTAQANKSTVEVGTHLENKTKEREEQQKELDRLLQDHKHMKKQKLQLEIELKKNKNALSLLDEKDQLEKSIDAELKKQDIKYEKIRESMIDSWRWLLNDKLELLLDKGGKELSQLRTKEAERTISEDIKRSLEEAISIKKCPTCEQDIENSLIEKLQQKIQNLNAKLTDEEIKRLKYLSSLQSKVKEIKTETKRNIVFELINDINDILIDVNDKRDKIKEIKELVEGIDEEKTRKINNDLKNIDEDVILLEEGIRNQEKVIADVNYDIEKLSDRLKSLGNKDIQKDKCRTELYENLHKLFDKGIAEYRDELKNRIQEDATILFQSLTTEPEYTGLRINDNYGLTIVRNDGNDVLVRSAGIEHIVALSLMGALQKNAPFRGPIIMDSPFGRLDDEHAPNVVSTLPIMAKQIVLLVFKKELTPAMAREKLQTKLISEYSLERVSSSFTQLEKK